MNSYGFNSFYNDQFNNHPLSQESDTLIGRIIVDYGNGYKAITDEGLFLVTISGKFRYSSDLQPVLGDFIILKKTEPLKGIIHGVLPRRTSFVRKIAGNEIKMQVQGANFDYIFIVTSANKDFNLRKLERYVLTAWDTGAEPVILLTKTDLTTDIDDFIEQIHRFAPGIDVVCISALYNTGLEALNKYLIPNKTIALFGSSGVGKSTLINTLSGDNLLKVNNIREDDARGRHTTTYRELIKLPNNTLIMDTPGMREIGIWDDGSGIDQTFTDIIELASKCRFSNCSHINEPHCMVQEAIANGTLPKKRLESYIKLLKEAAYIQKKAAKKIKTKKI